MSSNKLEGVQILRGYAAMLVVVTHLWSEGVISSVFRFSRIGGLGVDIFFIISGFIMCYSIRDRISPGDSVQFLKKRICRIYPIYLLVLIPFLIQYLAQSSSANDLVDPMLIIGNLLLLPSFFDGANYRMLVGPAWTLTYELFFYVLFAGAMVLSASKNRAIYVVMSSIVVMVALVNFFGLKGARLQWSNFQYMVGDTLMLNFVIGSICYFIWKKYYRPIFSTWMAMAAVIALTMIALLMGKFGFPRIVSLGLPAGAIVLIFLFAEFEMKRLIKPLLFIGSASYSIYLVHAVVAHWKYLVIGRGAHENDLTGILLTITAVVLGCAFYVVVEKPISVIVHRRAKNLPRPVNSLEGR